MIPTELTTLLNIREKMRTDYCGLIDKKYLGQTVTVKGWAHRRRDHGGVIFVDLRDRKACCRSCSIPDRAEVFAMAERVRNEFVLSGHGPGARKRPAGTANAEPEVRPDRTAVPRTRI